MEITK